MNKIIICTIIAALFILIKGQCPSNNVKSRFDCFSQSNGTHLCCYKNETNDGCEAIYITNLTQNKDFDCGIDELSYKEYEFTPYRPSQPKIELKFQSCGRTKPEKKNHCTDYSTIMNSCCRFKFNSNETGCYYLGKKYSGNSDKHIFTDDTGTYTYECHGASVRKSIFLLFFSILLLII